MLTLKTIDKTHDREIRATLWSCRGELRRDQNISYPLSQQTFPPSSSIYLHHSTMFNPIQSYKASKERNRETDRQAYTGKDKGSQYSITELGFRS